MKSDHIKRMITLTGDNIKQLSLYWISDTQTMVKNGHDTINRRPFRAYYILLQIVVEIVWAIAVTNLWPQTELGFWTPLTVAPTIWKS